MKTFSFASALVLATTSAFAAGSGDHGHGEGRPVGQPGSAAEVDRTIGIRMVETEEVMGFEPSELTVKEGETIRFAVSNAGHLGHEIVLGTEENNLAHKEEMAEMGQVDHQDANALRLAPGEKGQIV